MLVWGTKMCLFGPFIQGFHKNHVDCYIFMQYFFGVKTIILFSQKNILMPKKGPPKTFLAILGY